MLPKSIAANYVPNDRGSNSSLICLTSKARAQSSLEICVSHPTIYFRRTMPVNRLVRPIRNRRRIEDATQLSGSTVDLLPELGSSEAIQSWCSSGVHRKHSFVRMAFTPPERIDESPLRMVHMFLTPMRQNVSYVRSIPNRWSIEDEVVLLYAPEGYYGQCILQRGCRSTPTITPEPEATPTSQVQQLEMGTGRHTDQPGQFSARRHEQGRFQ